MGKPFRLLYRSVLKQVQNINSILRCIAVRHAGFKQEFRQICVEIIVDRESEEIQISECLGPYEAH